MNLLELLKTLDEKITLEIIDLKDKFSFKGSTNYVKDLLSLYWCEHLKVLGIRGHYNGNVYGDIELTILVRVIDED